MNGPSLVEVKAIIKSLVASSTNSRLTIDELNRDYKKSEGRAIPFSSFGYSNIGDFLRSINDCVQVFGVGSNAVVIPNCNEKMKHIVEMIKEQKRKSGNRRPRMPPVQQQQVPQHLYRNTVITSNNMIMVNNVPVQYSIPNNRVYVPVAVPYHYNQIFQNTFQNQYKPQYTNYVPIPHQHTLYAPQFASSPNQSKPQIPKSASNEIKSQVTTYEPTSHKNLNEAPNQNQREAPNVASQHSSPMHKTNNCTSAKPILEHVNISEPQRKSPLPKPEISKYNTEMKASEHNVTTEIEIKKSVSFSKKDELLTASNRTELPSTIEEANEAVTKLNEAVTEVNEAVTEDQTNIEAIPIDAVNHLVDMIDFPEGIVRQGQKIPSSILSSTKQVGGRFVIFISQVHSPFKFWFHFLEPDHVLDDLMDAIELYYEGLDGNVFCIPPSCIVPGQVCVALFKGRWYRAEVLSHVNNGMVQVLYIDYGTVAETPVNDIKYLRDSFALTPSQALRGCLSHVKPKGLYWSQQAIYWFLSMVHDLPLHARVSDIDEENRIYYFVLCNANGDDIININKELIYEGYALIDSEWLESNDEKHERTPHKCEKFPTFSMLELGEYPSLTTLNTMERNGIDYETITAISQYLNHPCALNTEESMPEFIRTLSFQLLSSNPFCNDILNSY